MSPPRPTHPMWQDPPGDILERILRTLDHALPETPAALPIPFFFRADDIGAPGVQFSEMMEPFLSHRIPLCLAVVPVWLSPSRWDSLKRYHEKDPALWCWHQHGWRHQNHEPEGKKQEFGPNRSQGHLLNDLQRGREKLSEILGTAFDPIFTPPWNRMSLMALETIRGLGYRAVSRFYGAKPPIIEGLPDLFMDVDLHTRKEPDGAAAWETLLEELRMAVIRGRCGIMLHHQRMNPKAVDFLNTLLAVLKKDKRIETVLFKDLLSRAADAR